MAKHARMMTAADTDEDRLNGSGMTASGAPTLLDISGTREKPLILSADLGWFTELVGQVVRGFTYLLAGQPGSRKSGLALQMALDLARRGQKVLFILTEEPAGRLLERALRMMSGWPNDEARQTLLNLMVEEHLSDVEALPNYLVMQVLSPTGRFNGATTIILDSIQGHGLSSGATAKWESLYDFFRLTQKARLTTLAICHFTKRNEVAGPRNLQHNVDAILVLRQMSSYRLLFCVKNRGGPASLRDPAKLELDPITLALRVAPHANMLTAVARTYLGAGLGESEVQSSVGLSNFGSRGRVVAPHLPKREIEQLVATIAQVPGINIDDLDFSINCRLPGERTYRGIVGLPLCLSLVSSYLQRPIPKHQIQIGEVDLMRQVRELPVDLVNQLYSALTSGELPEPMRLLVPPVAASQLAGVSGAEVVACTKIDDAIFQTWPDLR